MLDKTRRSLKILKVSIKYNIFSLFYTDIERYYIAHRKCSCEMGMKYRNNAIKLRRAFEELGPTFIKLGQTLSNRPDLLPRDYIMELEKLHDEVEPLPFDRMRESFEAECTCDTGSEGHAPLCYRCNDILEIFDEFDTKPIASASIGQVYKAVLNGNEVAVKIARPGVIDLINLDLTILKDVKWILSGILGFKRDFDIDGFLNEFKDMLTRELDYKGEALNIERFRENFKDVEGVKIPQVYWDYTRDSMLVMEFIHGTQIQDLRNIDKAKSAELIRLISEAYQKQIYIDGFFHADPHGGNIIALNGGGIALLDFGAVGVIGQDLQWNMFNMFYAIYEKDVDMATEYFLKIASLKEREIDMSAFEEDMDALIYKQHFSMAGEKHSDDYARLAVKYNMSLPAIFAKLARALFLVEDVCLELNPTFNIMDEAEELVKDATRARFSPKMAARNLRKDVVNYYMMFRDLPDRVDYTFDAVENLLESIDKRTVLKQKRYNNLKKAGYVIMGAAIGAFIILRLYV